MARCASAPLRARRWKRRRWRCTTWSRRSSSAGPRAAGRACDRHQCLREDAVGLEDGPASRVAGGRGHDRRRRSAVRAAALIPTGLERGVSLQRAADCLAPTGRRSGCPVAMRRPSSPRAACRHTQAADGSTGASAGMRPMATSSTSTSRSPSPQTAPRRSSCCSTASKAARSRTTRAAVMRAFADRRLARHRGSLSRLLGCAQPTAARLPLRRLRGRRLDPAPRAPAVAAGAPACGRHLARRQHAGQVAGRAR
jgi:hypothetical protein